MTIALIGALMIGLSLGLFGSGGSILTVPVLVYLLGQDEKVAIAGSLFIVGSISLIASLRGLKNIHWRSVIYFGIPGMMGTYMGAWLSQYVLGTVQLILFALLMAAAAWSMLRGKATDTTQQVPRASWQIIADGLVVGSITGLVGVGGGFLIVPALALLGGLTMHVAIATSLVIIALKSFSGLYKYLDVLADLNLTLDWYTLVLMAALGAAGSLIGAFLNGRLPQEQLKKLFGVFLLIMAVYILWKTAPNFF